MLRGPIRVVLAITLLWSAQSALPRGAITPELKVAMESTPGPIPVNIAMAEKIEAARLPNLMDGKGRVEPRETVVAELKRLASRSQGEVLACLMGMKKTGEVKDIRSLWVNNLVCCKATPEAIEKVAKMRGVRSVDLDETRRVIPSLRAERQLAVPGVEWNVSRINAPLAWVAGYAGQGVVVGHLDTGVNYYHQDLRDHIWINSDEVPGNGVDEDLNGYVDDYHGYDFHSRDGYPIDDNGHGTGTAGVIAGDGTGGDTTGVAPDAEIMCLKVTDSGGRASESNLWEAIQYAVENGAKVLNLSLGWPHSWGPDRESWRNALDNALVAGVVAAVAAGNERTVGDPPPDNIRTPGDVPPPWLHPDQVLSGGLGSVLTVGGTGQTDSISSFSSYGPVSWESVWPWCDYPYGPEMGLMDPDICAPAEAIVSLSAWINDQYVGLWSGTSFAAPHVSGAVALLLSMNSQLSPAMVDSVLEMTSLDLGPAGKDNDYGGGRVDLFEAIGIEVDLDIDNNSGDLSANTMCLYGLPGGHVFGRYDLVNPGSFESNPDGSDGPGNCDIDSIDYLVTGLAAGGGIHTIPASSVEPNCLRIDSLLYGHSAQNVLSVAIPSGLPTYPGYTGQVRVVGWASDVADTDQFSLSLTLSLPELWQNQPNPFRNRTEISYVVPSGLERVSLKVYTLSGRLVRTLVNESRGGGYRSLSWNCRDEWGKEASSGVYLYRLEAGDLAETKKMVLFK